MPDGALVPESTDLAWKLTLYQAFKAIFSLTTYSACGICAFARSRTISSRVLEVLMSFSEAMGPFHAVRRLSGTLAKYLGLGREISSWPNPSRLAGSPVQTSHSFKLAPKGPPTLVCRTRREHRDGKRGESNRTSNEREYEWRVPDTGVGFAKRVRTARTTKQVLSAEFEHIQKNSAGVGK